MINPAIVQPSQQIKKTTKIRPPTSLQFDDSRPLPHPTYLLFMCSKKRNRNLIVMNIQNDEWKNPAMFCHRVNNVNKKCEQLWTNDMKVVWNMLKNESHRIEIKHILQKKESLVSSVLSSFYSRKQKSIENWSVCSKLVIAEVGMSPRW